MKLIDTEKLLQWVASYHSTDGRGGLELRDLLRDARLELDALYTFSQTNDPEMIALRDNVMRSLLDERDSLKGVVERLRDRLTAPIQMLLWCPLCHQRHVDEGGFATRPHRSHRCENCGLVWRLSNIATVGVKYLPDEPRES